MACNSGHQREPNQRLQLTRAALLLFAPARCAGKVHGEGRVQLSRNPLGNGRFRYLVGLALALAASFPLSTVVARAETDPFQGAILAEENSAPRGPVVLIEWTPYQLSLKDVDRLRRVLHSARARGLKEEIESKRTGRVPGGIPGCSSPDFRLTFTHGGESWSGVLHLSCGWLQAQKELGTAIVFSDSEKVTLRSILKASTW